MGSSPSCGVEHRRSFVAGGAEDLDRDEVASRVVPAERHRGRGAAGEAEQGLGVVGVRAGRRVERGGLDGDDGGHRLTRQPADDVELVHAHVDEGATAGAPELRGRRGAVPLRTHEVQHLPEFARDDRAPAARPSRARSAASRRPGSATPRSAATRPVSSISCQSARRASRTGRVSRRRARRGRPPCADRSGPPRGRRPAAGRRAGPRACRDPISAVAQRLSGCHRPARPRRSRGPPPSALPPGRAPAGACAPSGPRRPGRAPQRRRSRGTGFQKAQQRGRDDGALTVR